MKKVIVIALLITVLTALLIGGGVCLADDGSQTNYYYVDKGVELTVRSSASQEGSVVMQIPATYAFEYVEEAQAEFIKIRYNSYEGYISKSDFNSYCKPVTSKWDDNPYFYTIALTNSNLNDTVTVYTDTKTSGNSALKSQLNVNKVYGYYHNGNDYFFFVQFNFTFGSPEPFNAYIKVSETSYSSFSKDTITESAGYAEETKAVEQPTPSGDADSVINAGSGDPGNTSSPATNNFERYLLIAVIAVLCVVIIILIFVPNKSRRRQ